MPDQVVNVHPSQRLALPWDEATTVDVDLAMVPLVRELWALGMRTEACCQDLGESLLSNDNATAPASLGRQRHGAFYLGQAWLKMPLEDAKAFLGKLAGHPKLHERQTRWTHPDAWMSFAYLLPDKTEGVAVSPWAQIHFPLAQICDVITALA